jgi:hypothetical protein
MATTLFKEVKYSLSKLVQDIEMGEIGLPARNRYRPRAGSGCRGTQFGPHRQQPTVRGVLAGRPFTMVKARCLVTPSPRPIAG